MVVNDFEMVAGDTKRIEVTVLDDSGAPVSLAMVEKIRWWLAKSVSREPLIQKSLVNAGIEVMDAVAGRFNIYIDPEDTAAMKHGDYYHEAEVVLTESPESLVATVFNGTCTIIAALIPPESP